MTPLQSMKAYGGRHGIDPPILTLAIRWSAVGFTLQLLYSLERPPGIHWSLGGLKIRCEQPGPLYLAGTPPRFYGHPAPSLALTFVP